MSPADPPAFVRALQHSDRETLASLLANEVIFNSPVATYRGRDDVAHLLGIIGDVLTELNSTGALGDGSRTVTLLAGRVGEHDVDGALVQVAGADGQLVELTLMLRPLSGLLAGVEEMGQRLSADPLPSERGPAGAR
jgi:hypothetical protein